MKKYINLRKFKEEELIFDDEETVLILKFIFKNKHNLIDGMEINNRVREFVQGLLLEAIDASYALGFIHSVFGGVFNPGAGFKKILTKFGRKALKQWFKHATAKDLMQIKIYDRVREQLEVNFSTPLTMYSNGTALNEINNSGFVAYNLQDNVIKIRPMVWG
jgi:hypothetical protein